MALLRWTGALLPYLAAVVWAFVGVVVGAGEPLFAVGAAVGLLVVVVAAVWCRRRGLRLRQAGQRPSRLDLFFGAFGRP